MSAPTTDLFAGTVHAPRNIEFTGQLLRDAHVVMKPLGMDNHPCPVLCVEVITPGQHIVQAEQVFPALQRFAADAVALRLTKGTIVTLVSPPQSMRLVLPCVEQVRIDATTP